MQFMQKKFQKVIKKNKTYQYSEQQFQAFKHHSMADHGLSKVTVGIQS